SDGDDIPDKIAWEFEVESTSAVRVIGSMRLRTGGRQYVPLPETLIPEGKSFVRFFASGYGQFGSSRPPHEIVDHVTLTEPGDSRNRLEVELNEPELRGESFVEHFVWPRMSVNGEITAREVDDDG